MAGQSLAKQLDGGPHEDPRELEAEELLNDGEEEEVREEKEEDENWDFSDVGGEKGTGKKAAAKAEEEVEAEVEDEKSEPEEKESTETEEVEAKTEGEGAKTEAEPEDEKTKYQTIPYQRFRKELVKRHAMAAELAQAKQQLEDLTKQMSDFRSAAGKASDPEPDSNIDPLGHTQWEVRQLKAQLDVKKAAESKPEDVFLSNQEIPVLTAAYREAVEEFKGERADFDAAYRHAINATANRLIEQNPNATQAQVDQAVQYLELREVKAALAQGKDPAERVYEIAQQLGYKTKAAVTTTTTEKSTIDDKVKAAAALADSKKRASSLAAKGSTINRRPLTIEDVEGMSNEEVVKFMDRNSGRNNPLMP